jgi:hypothetical protein
MIYTPRNALGSNQSTCYALEQTIAARPGRSSVYLSISLAFFVISMVIWSLSAVLFIQLRNHPRFRVVRPANLSLLLCFSQVAFAVAMSLNPAITTLPCITLLIFIMLGFSGFGINYFARLLNYVVQSQFALAMTPQIRGNPDGDQLSVTTGPGGLSVWSAVSGFSTFFSIVKLLMGFTALRDVSFAELFATKNAIGIVAIVVSLPGSLTTIVILAVIDIYQSCMGCSIYLEVFIGFTVTLAFYIALSSRVLYMAWMLKFPDDQESFKEFASTVVGVGGAMVLAVILIVADPDNVEYNYGFAFEWLFSVATYIYWWIAAGRHFLHVYRQRQTTYALKDNELNPTTRLSGLEAYMPLIASNDSLRQAFTQFVIGRYAAENLYFAQDVDTFKQLYFDRASNWRRSKSKFILNTYIRSGSPMEINVDHGTRREIVATVDPAADKIGDDSALLDVFDNAYTEITTHVLRALWFEFANAYRGSKLESKQGLQVMIPDDMVPRQISA